MKYVSTQHLVVAQKLIWYDLIGGIYLEILANSFFPRSEESEMRKSNKSLEQKQEKMIAFFSCEPQEKATAITTRASKKTRSTTIRTTNIRRRNDAIVDQTEG